MACCKKRLIVASASPRRRELLEKFAIPFEVIPARGPEDGPGERSAEEYVRALAGQKAAEVAGRLSDPEAVIVAADTVVEAEGRILGKPRDREDAAEMLRRLSGTDHRVWTGVCVRQGERAEIRCERTRVRFRTLTEEEIQAYVATGEPLDKAGAYGIQDRASLFVEGIQGDYFNVVGLPVCLLGQMLRSFGVELL